MSEMLTDINGDFIFDGEDYYQTPIGAIRMDGLSEFRRYGKLKDICSAIDREDDLAAAGDDPDKLDELREEIGDLSDEEFLDLMGYSIWTAGGFDEDERYERHRYDNLH